MSRSVFALVVVVVMTVAPSARSVPMSTAFSTIRSGAPLVVIGTVQVAAGLNSQSIITVDVEKAIRGNAARGPMGVKDSPDGHVFVGPNRVIAFIDNNNALRWVGELVAGASLETGVIKLKGFFDWNAHLVEPGLMTFAELQKLLATGQLDQTFDATLAFRDGHGGIARSTRTLTVQYAPLTNALSVPSPLPACLRATSLFGLESASFLLSLTNGCPSTTPNARQRNLHFEGTFTGVDASNGHIQVQLVPTRPFLTEAEYASFAADGGLATMTSVVGLALSDGTSWAWHPDQDLVDAHGKAHSVGGVSMSSQSQNGKTVTRDEYGFDDDIRDHPEPWRSWRHGTRHHHARGIEHEAVVHAHRARPARPNVHADHAAVDRSAPLKTKGRHHRSRRDSDVTDGEPRNPVGLRAARAGRRAVSIGRHREALGTCRLAIRRRPPLLGRRAEALGDCAEAVGRRPIVFGRSPRAIGRSRLAHGRFPLSLPRRQAAIGRCPEAVGRGQRANGRRVLAFARRPSRISRWPSTR